MIIVQNPPQITLDPPEGELSLTEGDELKLTCTATGNPSPHVVWDPQIEQYPRVLDSPPTYSISGEATIQSYQVKMSDAKVYTCTATNEAGTDRKYISVIVNRRRGDTGKDRS